MICFCTWFTLDRSICLVRIESNMKLSRQRQRQWKWTQREAENTKRHKFISIQILSTSPLLVYVFFLNLYFDFFQRCLMYLLTQNLLKFANYKIVYNLDQILTFSTLQMVFIDFCAFTNPTKSLRSFNNFALNLYLWSIDKNKFKSSNSAFTCASNSTLNSFKIGWMNVWTIQCCVEYARSNKLKKIEYANLWKKGDWLIALRQN